MGDWSKVIITLLVATAITTAIFFVSSCVNRDGDRNVAKITACVQAGGSWVESASDACILGRQQAR